MRTRRRRQPTTRKSQVTMIITTIGWPRCGTLSLCEQFVLRYYNVHSQCVTV